MSCFSSNLFSSLIFFFVVSISYVNNHNSRWFIASFLFLLTFWMLMYGSERPSLNINWTLYCIISLSFLSRIVIIKVSDDHVVFNIRFVVVHVFLWNVFLMIYLSSLTSLSNIISVNGLTLILKNITLSIKTIVSLEGL